ncbi:hypothetical protein [Sinorhizobium fredii]|uniref:hypothetical protein n=1 Tax=Rhizobium fredii TaxID=380 RepID=UPI000595602E|nr:hypothetical protein [Sinorhizobium fredii]WOS64257.1 hypothetical protein SFGR64A_07770 [Sinorhizobium fredii GR64]
MGGAASGGKVRLWVSEADAVRHISEVTECDEADAERDLHHAVIDGDVEVHACQAEFRLINNLGRREWLRVHLSLNPWLDSIEVWDDGGILISKNDEKEHLRIDATGIELRRKDVLRLWPVPERDKTEIAQNKGGRPPKYDREEIDAYIIAYILEKAPETIAEVVRALQAEFEGEPLPDRRALERIVSKVFKNLEELKRSRGGKT